jgi:aminopeptidase N
MALPGCGPVVVNHGQSGYYRTLYAPQLFARLTAGYTALEPADQIGLLSDSWGLGLAGYQSASLALDLIDRMPATANTQVASSAADVLTSAQYLYEGDPKGRALVARYAIAKLSPFLSRLGMSPRTGDSSNDAVLRSHLIQALGDLGDPAVTAEARRRFAALARDPKALDGPLRTTILGIVAASADAATWDQLHAQALAEKVPLVRSQLFALLASTRDEALARRALALALTPEPGATNSSAMIAGVAENHPDLAFDFALAHRAQVAALVDASAAGRFFPQLAAGSANPAMIAKLRDYAARFMTPASRRPADIAIGRIEDRVRIRRTATPAITKWLQARS